MAALSRAHDLVFEEQWDTTRLADVIERALAPFLATANRRIAWSGPLVMVPARSAITVALALHELATNAVKYGSLSNDVGTVAISWSGSLTDGEPFRFEWRELGGPAVQPPTRQGFGTGLIERSLASELKSKVELVYASEGFTCRVSRPSA